MERRSEAYRRSNCDFRNSGGLYEGGCVLGNRAIGGEERANCSCEGAGVTAAAVAYCRCRGCLHRRIAATAREGGCIRGGI